MIAAWRALQAEALGLPPLRVRSIESSPAWLSQLRGGHLLLRQAEAKALVKLESASIEPTGKWG